MMRNRVTSFGTQCLRIAFFLCGFIIAGCSYDFSPTDNSSPTDEGISVYRNIAENPHRDRLIYCMEYTCSISSLPFIGTETENPTVEDLLNRTIVSHRWMGKRFEQIIRAMDDKTRQAILQLSRSIVAVVISAEVRPSHYRPSSSIIYLDPLRIALTDEELRVIDQTPDYRSNFGKGLKFVGLWRYVTSGNEYFYTGTLEGRTLQTTVNYLARLLFHELAHANDFYPHNTISDISCVNPQSLRCGLTPLGNYNGWAFANRLSIQFGIAKKPRTGDYRLHNHNMEAYAGVRYLGGAPNDGQKAVLGVEIGGWMASDEANHDYAYTTPYEDVAMLVEATLVKYLFNADMDVGYINITDSGTVSALTTPVTWGQRGRIGAPAVARRAKRITDLMLPGFITEGDDFFNNLETPSSMQTACGWRDNLDLSCTPSALLSRNGAEGGEETASSHDLELDMLNPHW